MFIISTVAIFALNAVTLTTKGGEGVISPHLGVRVRVRGTLGVMIH